MPATTPPATFILIVAFVCITLGYVFGWIVSSSQRNRSEKKSEKETRDPVELVAAAQPFAQPPVQAAKEHKVDRTAMFRVLRNTDGNGIVVEVGGKAFFNGEDMTLEERKHIELALRATANWMGFSYQLGEPTPTKTPAPEVAPVEIVPTAPTIANDEQMRPTKVLSDMTGALADALQPSMKKEAPKSIVEQIDSIFQEKLLGTPHTGQKIYIAEDPKRGVIVRVGDKVYEGVGSLPEGEVKTILRSAVADWEREQEVKNRRTP